MPRSYSPRLILEIVAAFAASGLAIMGVLSVLTPGATMTGSALLDAFLLSIVATALVIWRLVSSARRDLAATADPSTESYPRGSAAVLAGDAAWRIVGARLAYATVLVMCLLIAVSWMLGWSIPRSLLEGLPTMKFNTAASLVLLSIGGLLSTCLEPPKRQVRTASYALMALAALIAFATALEHLLDVDLGIDTLAGSDPESLLVGRVPGRMSAATAAALLFLAGGMGLGPIAHGAGPLTWAKRNLPRVGVTLNALGGLVGLAACVLFVASRLGVPSPGAFATVAIHTIAFILTLSAGTHMTRRALEATPDAGTRALAVGQLRRSRSTVMVLVGVLFSGLIATIALMAAAAKGVQDDREAAFVEKSQRVLGNLHQSLSRPVVALRDASNMGAHLKRLSADDLAAFAASRDVQTDFRGIASLGSLDLVRGASEGVPRLVVRSLFWSDDAARSVGSAWSEDSAVVDAAREALASGRIAIAERRHPTAGGGALYELVFFLRTPNWPEPSGTTSGRLLFTTWRPVPASFGSPNADAGLLNLELFAGSDGQRVFGAPEVRGPAPVQLDHPVAREPIFTVRESFSVAGHTLTLQSSSTPHFEARVSYALPLTLGISGALLSVIVTLMVWSLGVTRSRALNLAHEMTAELANAKETEERLAEIARKTSNSVVITDACGRIEWVNEGYTRATGLDAKAAAGEAYPHLPSALFSGTECPAAARVEVLRPGPTGLAAYLNVEVTPLRDAAGQLSGFMAIETDVTASYEGQAALQRLNSELLVAREAAETASHTKSAFLANMSHEIRTPLTAILGFADILVDENASEVGSARRAEAAETIRSAGAHLLAVISDILDLSKIEAGKMTLERLPLSTVDFLRDVGTIMRPRAAEKGLTLTIGLMSPIPNSVLGDPTRLRQIVMNLVGNAVKFTDAGRVTVTAGVHPSGKDLVVEVEDTGIGLTPDQSSRLFNAFEQADESVTRKHGGTGLGLSIARRLAGMMGGELTLSWSERGRGARFRFTMPMDVPATAHYVSSLESAAPAKPAPHSIAIALVGRILLAEDGPENRVLLTHHLRKAGADVDVAADGAAALKKIRDSVAAGAPYDLLLTDIQMPVMDGYALAKALRRDGSRLPIIALTANAMAEDQQRCLDAGCDDYLSKPIDKVALVATCARWLTRQSARRPTPAPEGRLFQVA